MESGSPRFSPLGFPSSYENMRPFESIYFQPGPFFSGSRPENPSGTSFSASSGFTPSSDLGSLKKTTAPNPVVVRTFSF